MKVGARVHLFNANLRARRIELGFSQSSLAETIGVHQSTVSEIERLILPSVSVEKIKPIFYAIADALDESYEKLFPADYLIAVQEKLLPRSSKFVLFRDIDILSLPLSTEALMLPPPDEMAETRIMQDAVRDVIEDIPPREKRVLELRYGLIDGEPMVIEDVAKRMGVSRERVRQIEAMALSRLRNPRSRNKLRYFLEEDK